MTTATQTNPTITILNATPMMADVLSGLTPRPTEWAGHGWTAWVQATPGYQALCRQLAGDDHYAGRLGRTTWQMPGLRDALGPDAAPTIMKLNGHDRSWLFALNSDGTRVAYCPMPPADHCRSTPRKWHSAPDGSECCCTAEDRRYGCGCR